MGHYDEQREEQELSDLKSRANHAGRIVEDQREYEKAFLPSKKAFLIHEALLKQLKIYHRLKHKYEKS
tara:strand:+ start:3849 stop:4052 length:204 start_codon:yes stop_codon:yes gene_type:complete